MIPFTFAYDNLNYARSLSAYYAEMSNIEFEHLTTGGLSVQLSDGNTFGRIPVDQTIEETVNRDTQTAAGTKGFSLNAGAISRYYMSAEFRSSYLRIESLGLNENSKVSHKDLSQTRLSRDENGVKTIVDLLVQLDQSICWC